MIPICPFLNYMNGTLAEIIEFVCNCTYWQIRDGKGHSTLATDGLSICGGDINRIRPIYVSDSNEVEIQLSSFRPGEENKPRFLIKYEGMYCKLLV